MPAAGPALVDLATDRDQTAIVRATALDLLAQYENIGTLAMVQSLGDADALVRTTAVRGLESRPPKPRLSFVGSLLEDPVRAVRIEAARVLTDVPAELFDSPQRQAFEAALAEWQATQQAIIDEPSAHLNLAVMHMKQRDPAGAEEEYHAALRLDPAFLPARFNLAGLYNGLGRNDEAEQQLRHIILQEPDSGEAYYSLGLLFAETERLEDSVEMLGQAVKLLPHRARVQYNYALALQHLDRRAEAERALLAAYRIQAGNPDILHALAIFYVQQADWPQAMRYAKELISVAPDAPGPQQLLKHIEAELVTQGSH
jgi:tetratricopeptide (TPR) repeat protein